MNLIRFKFSLNSYFSFCQINVRYEVQKHHFAKIGKKNSTTTHLAGECHINVVSNLYPSAIKEGKNLKHWWDSQNLLVFVHFDEKFAP